VLVSLVDRARAAAIAAALRLAGVRAAVDLGELRGAGGDRARYAAETGWTHVLVAGDASTGSGDASIDTGAAQLRAVDGSGETSLAADAIARAVAGDASAILPKLSEIGRSTACPS
jgi:hypothetical protein